MTIPNNTDNEDDDNDDEVDDNHNSNYNNLIPQSRICKAKSQQPGGTSKVSAQVGIRHTLRPKPKP